jgi:hypothetical protein
VVTLAGAVTGRLAAVYLVWWLLGLIVGGVATAVLAKAWTPRHPVLMSAAVAALIGLGPEAVLGTTTPALPNALPHELGGFLAYLSAALLITRRQGAAAFVIVATAAVHVQVGALASVVGIIAFSRLLLERRGGGRSSSAVWSRTASWRRCYGFVQSLLRRTISWRSAMR